MKKIINLLLTVLFSASVFAQAPASFSYQAVVRNADGTIIAGTPVGIKISILAGSATGTAVCVEEFTPTTNDNGLVTLQIGSVNTTDFGSIDWSAQDYFVKVELDPEGGTSYTEMGTSQLLSVPYALYAKNAGENLYFDNGKVGIGTDSPARQLTINSKAQHSYILCQTNTTGTTVNDGFLTGIQHGTSDAYIWNYENGDINIGTNNATRMKITELGNVGIGTAAPAAKLSVVGSSKFGSSGVVFEELREITGTTDASTYYVSVDLPTGYNENNTRIMSLEINYNGDRWAGLGNDNISGSNIPISYIVNGSKLYIYYPNSAIFKNKHFRVLLMRIQ